MSPKFRYKFDNSGFTLVELIAVLVVLAILAAILTPNMLSYIDNLGIDDIESNTETLRNVAQARIYDLYSEMSYNQDGIESIMGTNSMDFDSAMSGQKLNNFKDCDIHNSELAKNILKDLGFDSDSDSPNIVLLVMGRYDYYMDYTKEYYDPLKAYTIYEVIYQPVANGKIYYYFNGELLTKKNIYRQGSGDGKTWYNSIEVNGEKVYVQYYLLKSYKKDNSNTQTIGNDFWNYFNSQLNTYNK